MEIIKSLISSKEGKWNFAQREDSRGKGQVISSAMEKSVIRKHITPSHPGGHPFEDQVFFLHYMLAVVGGALVQGTGDDGG